MKKRIFKLLLAILGLGNLLNKLLEYLEKKMGKVFQIMVELKYNFGFIRIYLFKRIFLIK